MQTHKNPNLRTGPAPFKAPGNAAGSPSKSVLPASAPIDKPPVFTRDGKKWLIVRFWLPLSAPYLGRDLLNRRLCSAGVPKGQQGPHDRHGRDEQRRLHVSLPRLYSSSQRKSQLDRYGLVPQIVRCFRLCCVQRRVCQLSECSDAGMLNNR